VSAKREFGADPELKNLYHTYLSIIVVGGFLWWLVPLTVALTFLVEPLIGVIVALSILVPLFIIVSVALYWIPKFYSSIKYVLEADEIVVAKGVWWKTKSVVPYNRITNVNIYQGPISRHYGVGRLAIQTAGFSGVNSSGHKIAEAEIIGIKNFEETKDVVMSFVKGIVPVAVEAEAEPARSMNEEILEELRRIRKAVEK